MNVCSDPGIRLSWSSCEVSTSTRPATSAGYSFVYTRTLNPPNECATKTYGPFSPDAASSACSSFVISPLVRGSGPAVLQPYPARSYEQTRANFATSGCTNFQPTAGTPSPVSKITVGLPRPEQSRFSDTLGNPAPSATERPSCGNRRASRQFAIA